MSLTPEAHEAKLAAGRSIRASKAAATRKKRASLYERRAKHKAAMDAYFKAHNEARENGTKLPNMKDFFPAGGF